MGGIDYTDFVVKILSWVGSLSLTSVTVKIFFNNSFLDITMSLRLVFLPFLLFSTMAMAQNTISLPSPNLKLETPLMQALAERHSTREFSPKALENQIVSDLFYSALGINRPDGRRTSPTAKNVQDITAYAIFPDGAYLYEPSKHELVKVSDKDLRGLVAGFQDFVKTAPLSIVFVGEDKYAGALQAENMMHFDAGSASENALLYCSATKLACVPRITMDKAALSKELGLKKNQLPISNIVVGYPVGK